MRYKDVHTLSVENPRFFWRQKMDLINWHEAPEKVLFEDEDGLTRWYRGGKLNTSYLALDYHVWKKEGDTPAPFVQKLMQSLKPYVGGNCSVFLDYRGSDYSGTMLLGEQWNLHLKESLLQEMRKILGEEAVRVSYSETADSAVAETSV